MTPNKNTSVPSQHAIEQGETTLHSLQSLIERTPGCRKFPRATKWVAQTFFPKTTQARKDKQIRLVREALLHKKLRPDREVLLDSQGHDGSLLYSWQALASSIDSGHVGPADEKVHGGQLAEKVFLSPAYQEMVVQRGLEARKDETMVRHIRQAFIDSDIERIIDVGGGTGKKITQILENADVTKMCSNKIITTKDTSPYFVAEHNATIASRAKKHNLSGTIGRAMLEDFLSDHDLKAQKGSGRVIFAPGDSICQYSSADEIIAFLSTLSSDKVNGSRDVFFDFHTLPDEIGDGFIPNASGLRYHPDIEDLLCAYGGHFPQNHHYSEETYIATKQWVMSSFTYYFGHEVVKNLRFESRYESLGEKGGRIMVGAVANEKITIEGREYAPGEFISRISVMLHRVSQMESYVRAAGGTPVYHATNGTETTMYFKTKSFNPENKTPEQVSATMRNKLLLYGTLLMLGGGFYLKHSIQEQEKEKTRDAFAKKIEARYGSEQKSIRGQGDYGGQGPVSIDELKIYRPLYEKEFHYSYGLQESDIEALKIDFLDRYAKKRHEQYTQGDNGIFGLHTYYGNDYAAVMMNYLESERDNIELDKGIIIGRRYAKLATHEQALLYTGPTITLTTDELEKENVIIQMPYLISSHFEPDEIVIIQRKNEEICLMKNKSNDTFSSYDIKNISDDYFVMPGQAIFVKHVEEKILGQHISQSLFENNIYEKCSQLCRQGYDFTLTNYMEGNEYSLRLSAFLMTYFSDVLVDSMKEKFVTPYYSSDIRGLLGNCRNTVSATMQALHSPIKLSERDLNRTESHICNEIIHESEIFRNKTKSSHQGVHYLLKTYANKWTIGTALEGNYPFTEENLEVNESRVGLGYNAKPATGGYGAQSDIALIFSGQQTKRYKSSFMHTSYSMAGGRYGPQKKYVMVPYSYSSSARGTLYWHDPVQMADDEIHPASENKHVFLGSLGDRGTSQKDHPLMGKLVEYYIQQKLMGNYDSGRGEAEEKIIKEGRIGRNIGAYDALMEKRRLIREDLIEFLQRPNSFVGEIIYRDITRE